MIGQTFRQESNKQFGKDQSYLCAHVWTGWVKHTRIMHLEYLAMRFCQKQLLLN